MFGVKFNGDNFSYDRQAWLKKNLPFTKNGFELLDVGVRKSYSLGWLEQCFKDNNLITLRKGFLSGSASILLLSISRKIPVVFNPLFRLIVIPFTILANLIDRLIFYKYPHSYSVYFVLQKY